MTAHEILKKAKELYPTDINKGHVYNDIQHDKRQAFIEGSKILMPKNNFAKFDLSGEVECFITNTGFVNITYNHLVISLYMSDIERIKTEYESLQPF